MAVIPRMHDPAKITCSIGIASALFDLSNDEFISRYIRRNKIVTDKLHQLDMKRVLQLYDQTPDRKKTLAIRDWQARKQFDSD